MAKKNVLQTGCRLIGTVIPVGALRTAKSIGVGEFADLAEFGELCAAMGIGLVQVLPVNDTGYHSSPYSALTAFALNPLYLRIGDLPEAAGFEADIAAIKNEFEGAERFPYEALLRAKMNLLRKIYRACGGGISADPDLNAWIQNNSWVKPYAVFRRLKEANGEKSWREWDTLGQPAPSPATIAAMWNDPPLKEEHRFWAWLQKALDEQFSAAAASLAALGILLEGDLPILMNEDSCDVWANPEIFDLNLSAGAPPDMYSPEGQNWGFPIYNWHEQSKDGYAWWKARLKTAEKYYQAYRIDHVLGFFRIWASRREENSATLGRYVPCVPVSTGDFTALGFDAARIRWMSQPHIFTGEVWDALRAGWGGAFAEEDIAAAAGKVFTLALNRIDGEELWLFKPGIRGEKDIAALDIHRAAKGFLAKAWANRLFFEHEPGQFFPAWYYRTSRAYASLSPAEKQSLDALVELRGLESEKIWEDEGRHLLSELTSSTSMLACAEDLGAVPACVPRVLETLGILGLRVVRWYRDWNTDGQPYARFEDYPERSVCTPAVHDSSCLREWWDKEADQRFFSNFLGVPSLPKVYNPGTARIILSKIATCASRFRVFQMQDLLHLSSRWYTADPAAERINVPGTVNDFNWTYRLPATIGEIMNDEALVRAVRELAAVKSA
ncbi:MAG: 4-alpha-glucanotransferase [Treponema sp.]|nr:4-alpha-glucanotransferase [Treponema sp.]